jgi:hypothetical protein
MGRLAHAASSQFVTGGLEENYRLDFEHQITYFELMMQQKQLQWCAADNCNYRGKLGVAVVALL